MRSAEEHDLGSCRGLGTHFDEGVFQGDGFEGEGAPRRSLRVVHDAHAPLDGLRIVHKGLYQLDCLVRAQHSRLVPVNNAGILIFGHMGLAPITPNGRPELT